MAKKEKPTIHSQTHTQHKCVPRMLPTTNQALQQWTPAPSPSLKLTDRKKKTHPREKMEENNICSKKHYAPWFLKKKIAEGQFGHFQKNARCT